MTTTQDAAARAVEAITLRCIPAIRADSSAGFEADVAADIIRRECGLDENRRALTCALQYVRAASPIDGYESSKDQAVAVIESALAKIGPATEQGEAKP